MLNALPANIARSPTPAPPQSRSGVPLATNISSIRSAARTEIEDKVSAFNHVEIMLDNNHGVAEIG